MSRRLENVLYERSVLVYNNPEGPDQYYRIAVTQETNGCALWAALLNSACGLCNEEKHFDKLFVDRNAREDALEAATHKAAWAAMLNQRENPLQVAEAGEEEDEGQ